jgi:hypothetical protein
MAHVAKDEEYVAVGYCLICGFQRAEALAKYAEDALKEDQGFLQADDETNGFWPDGKSLVVVHYRTLADANRLDPVVRRLLGTTGKFTYEAHAGTSYGQRGAHLSVRTSTTFTPNRD